MNAEIEADKELWGCLALRHAEGVGARRIKRLIARFGSASAAVQAAMENPGTWGDLVPTSIARRFALQKWRAPARLEWQAARSPGCRFLLWNDPRYPDTLRAIADAPPLLYYLGDPALLHGPAVAVVGARKCTREGLAVAAFLSRDLARAGVTIISGMARGIDRAAHLAGLEGPGRSIAVLGTGIDMVYPEDNRDLYQLLTQRGLLVTEFGPGTRADACHFPMRNRLISGLAQGVLVVEAARRSGSLITARQALDQGRDVFAVPGHTTAAVSEGCRNLIRQGARPVFSADDILAELAPQLTFEARRALDKRLSAAPSPDVAGRAGPAAGLHVADAADVPPVLPEGLLPWEAAPKKPLKKSPGRRPGNSARMEGAPGASGRKAKPLPLKPQTEPAMEPAMERVPEPTAETESGPATEQASGRVSGFALELASGPVPELVPEPVSEPVSEQAAVLAALDAEPRHIDELCRTLGLEVSRLSGLLVVLEIRGRVRRLPGMRYTLP